MIQPPVDRPSTVALRIDDDRLVADVVGLELDDVPDASWATAWQHSGTGWLRWTG